MGTAISIVLVIFFLMMNAFFVTAEFALVRVRRSQIEMAVEEGKRGSKNAKLVADNVNAYLSACQLGITLASLALGWLGEPAVASVLRTPLTALGLPSELVSPICVAVGFALITMLHIVVGELIPKSFAIFSTERYALGTATLLVWFYRITYPVMILFNGITNTVVRLFGHDPANEHDVYTDEELRLLIDESTESGFIDPDQNEFFDNIFDLSDKDAEVIMTPRTDMVCLDLEKPLEENLETIRQHKYTRYPVCRGSKDDIVGFVHMKDLYGLPVDTPIEDWKLREIPAVPETISIARLLGTMQERRTDICVVIDEHGGTAGIVTMSDVMEQIVGRIEDEYVHYPDEDVVMLHDGTYLVDGAMVINDFEDLLGFEPEEAEEVETAGGLMMALFDRIPDAGDTTTLESRDTIVNFTILDMDRFRIDKIAVKIQKKEQPAKDESSSERSSDSWKSKVQKSERD